MSRRKRLALFGVTAAASVALAVPAWRAVALGPEPLTNARIPVELDALLGAYRSNKGAADARFLGHIVETSGTVSDISRYHSGVAYVLFGDGPPRLQCEPTTKAAGLAESLSKGAHIRIRGLVSGADEDVLLDHCELY